MHYFFIIIFSLLLSFKSYSSNELISSYKVSDLNKNLSKIANKFEIKSKNKNSFIVYVQQHELELFNKLAPKALLLTQDINQQLKTDNKSRKFYRKYSEVRTTIAKFIKDYPQYTELIEYGRSKSNRPLFALKISNKDTLSKTNLMITAATHGDELITVEAILGIIHSLLKKQSSSSRFQNFINGKSIFFIPVVNPDGFIKRNRYSHRVDPNRAYPMPVTGERLKKNVQCIDQLITFFHQQNIQGVIDFHAHGKMIMFPWAYSLDKINAADFSTFYQLTTEMALAPNYKHGQISKVIYTAKGSSSDYYYSSQNAVAIAIELGKSKYPRSSKIQAIVQQASEMVWRFIDHF